MMQKAMAAQQTQAMLMQQMMMQQSAGGKKTREVYVGNLAIGMVTDQMLREFFNTALAGLSPEAATQPSVVNIWMASDMKYAFVELRTPDLATIAMGLDKVELCGRSIHCGRPGGYVPPDASGGQQPMGMGMPNMGMMGMGLGMPAAAGPPATQVVCLANMLSIEELASEEYDEIVSDIRDECSTFGTIEELIIPRPAADGSSVPGIGKAYIKFADAASAQKASTSLTGRTFD
jgi:splicing factor U2AF subunit